MVHRGNSVARSGRTGWDEYLCSLWVGNYVVTNFGSNRPNQTDPDRRLLVHGSGECYWRKKYPSGNGDIGSVDVDGSHLHLHCEWGGGYSANCYGSGCDIHGGIIHYYDSHHYDSHYYDSHHYDSHYYDSHYYYSDEVSAPQVMVRELYLN
jgi:hypothetical protein